MATVYFVREGAGNDRAYAVAELFASDAVSHFAAYERAYSAEPPVIGTSSTVTDYSAYQYIVLKIAANETSHAFTEPGYYIIKGLHPSSAAAQLGLNHS